MSSRAVLRLLFAGYTVLLAVVGFFPTPVDREASPAIWWFIRGVRRLGFEWYSYELLEFSANVLLFVPFGLLGLLVVGLRFWWVALVLGVTASVVIETGQELLLPERMPSTSDVVANALGTTLGVAAGCLILILRARRTQAAA
ncbi:MULTISPECIES: VanZ family protein [unclassified Agromyces]|uniref:VanZ family protein n=1 Tax=unclassified Agromyces TaxID=2639701 RepID=UPI003014FD39